jgi:hypothetical protein
MWCHHLALLFCAANVIKYWIIRVGEEMIIIIKLAKTYLFDYNIILKMPIIPIEEL